MQYPLPDAVDLTIDLLILKYHCGAGSGGLEAAGDMLWINLVRQEGFLLSIAEF